MVRSPLNVIRPRQPLRWQPACFFPRNLCVFRRKHGPVPFPHYGLSAARRGRSPLLYPGNAPPPGTPALQLVKEGYTVVAAEKMAISLPRQRFSARLQRFPGFGSFRCSAVDFTVPRPIPSDRTCPVYVFYVFSDFHVFVRFGRLRCSDVVFTVPRPIPRDRTCPTCPVYVTRRVARLQRFCPFWPFSLFGRGLHRVWLTLHNVSADFARHHRFPTS